jgi:plasmid stabilization system protein ParE
MTRFTVTWWPDAEEDLAHLWLQATDRRAVSATADAIDQLLRTEPLSQGSEAAGSLRLLTVASLSVLFSVAAEDCKVIVWAVRGAD